MTFMRARDAARAGRHQPAIGSSRLAAVAGASGPGSFEARLPRAPMASAQQTAQALIGAEQALVQAESHYVEAKAELNAAVRLNAFGESDKGLFDAERRLAITEDARRLSRERVEQLRRQLHEHRRTQLTTKSLPQPAAARGVTQGGGGPSLFARLLKR